MVDTSKLLFQLQWKRSSSSDKSLEGTEIADTKNWDENSNALKQDSPNVRPFKF